MGGGEGGANINGLIYETIFKGFSLFFCYEYHGRGGGLMKFWKFYSASNPFFSRKEELNSVIFVEVST